jgi:hypothetical protein
MTARQVLQVQERIRQRLALKDSRVITVDWSGQLGRLSPQQREFMGLVFLGHKPGLIAQMLGITANAARANLCLAKGTLAAAAPVEEGKAPAAHEYRHLSRVARRLEAIDSRWHSGWPDRGACACGAAPRPAPPPTRPAATTSPPL